MRPALAAAPPGPLGVAVSGGGDSVALLLLLERWAGPEGRALAAVTVDHGLRAGSAAEAAGVGRLCAARGIPHRVLAWQAPGRGNLQDAAREGRRALIAGWAAERGLAAVALGHTLDDQAETVLMRLARGSGVDGLAAMAPAAAAAGTLWLRPLLGVRRAALREWLAAEGVPWAEDPANADPAFARIRARAALAALAPLGLTAERLAATAARMADARAALEADVRALAAAAAEPGEAGDVLLDPARLAAAPREVGLRLLAAAVMWATGARYRPRVARLEAAHGRIAAGALGAGLTLAGSVLRPWRGRIAVRREPAAAAAPVPLGRIWDGRWALAEGPEAEGLTVGALGAAGLAEIPGWRAGAAAPREVLLTTPAVRGPGGLVGAPFLGRGPWRFGRVAPIPPPWPAALARRTGPDGLVINPGGHAVAPPAQLR